MIKVGIFKNILQSLKKMIKLLIGDGMDNAELLNIYKNYQSKIVELRGLLWIRQKRGTD